MASGLLSSEAVFYTRLRAVRHSDPTYLQEVKSNMPTQAKRENIDMLCEALKKSDAVIIVEYRGLTVKKISEVRRLIRKAGGEMKVSKNTLMRIALQECGMVQAPEYDFGPNGYVISYGDAAAVAKAVRDFAKEKGNEASSSRAPSSEDSRFSTSSRSSLSRIFPRRTSLSPRSSERSRLRFADSSRSFPARRETSSPSFLRSRTRRRRPPRSMRGAVFTIPARAGERGGLAA